MFANPAASITRLEVTQPLAVRLFKEDGAPPLALSRAVVADFADVASEAWRTGCLCASHPKVSQALVVSFAAGSAILNSLWLHLCGALHNGELSLDIADVLMRLIILLGSLPCVAGSRGDGAN
jgi:hypothetical protein